MMSLQSERMEAMSNQDKIKSALEKIDDGLAAISTNEDWLKYLQFQSFLYCIVQSSITLETISCTFASSTLYFIEYG